MRSNEGKGGKVVRQKEIPKFVHAYPHKAAGI